MNEIRLSNYRYDLISFANSEQLAGVDNDKIGMAFNAFDSSFEEAYPDIDDEDRAEMKKISAEVSASWKSKAEIPRFIPKAEEFELYYGSQAPDFSGAKNADEKIAIAKKWEEDGFKRASSLVPSQSEDFKTHLEWMTNNNIRQAMSDDNKTGWFSDKAYRAVEGGLSMVSPFIPGADRFLAENLPENTEMDEDISSLLFAGVGQLASQAAIALGTSAIAGPQAGVAAIGTIYSARALVEGYKEEMRKSGNSSKALDVGLSGVPGAALEVFADSFLLGLGGEGKLALKAFKEATTRETKEAIIKAAIPSLGSKAFKAGLVEASVGSVGADLTTGFGRYLASGDESYIPSVESLAKGALVEGILGAGYTTAFNRPSTEMNQVAQDLKTFSQDKADASQIFKALKEKNYDLAVDLATKDYANQPEKKDEASKIISEGLAKPSDEARNKALSSILPTHRSVLKSKMQEFEKAGDMESAKRIAESLESIKAGTFTDPESIKLDSNIDGFDADNSPVSIADGNVVTLDNGSEIDSGEDVIYVKGLSKSSLIVNNLINNGAGLALNASTGKASLIFGNKTKSSGLTFSQSPKAGYTAIRTNQSKSDAKGNRIITDFSPLGEVAGYKKSEQAKQNTKATVDQATNEKSPQEVKDAGQFIQEVNSVEGKLNDDSYNSFKDRRASIKDRLYEYSIKNPDDKNAQALWFQFIQASVKLDSLNTSNSQQLKPVRENQNIFQEKVEEERVQSVKDNLPKPILQNLPDGKTRSEDVRDRLPKPILQNNPEIGDNVEYEGYSGTLVNDGSRLAIQTQEGQLVEVSDRSNLSLLSRDAGNQEVASSNITREESSGFSDMQEPEVKEASFSSNDNGSLSIVDESGNVYVPNNKTLSRNFQTSVAGNLEVLVRRSDNPGQVIRLVGNQAKQAQDAFIDAAAAIERSGGKISLDAPYTGKSKKFTTEIEDNGIFHVYDDGTRVRVIDKNGNIVNKVEQKTDNKNTSDQNAKATDENSVVAPAVAPAAPTVEAITATPEAVFESVSTDNTVIETVVVPSNEPIVSQEEALIVKEIERAKGLIEIDPSYSQTVKELEDQLALLKSTNEKDVITAIQKIKEDVIFDKKEASDSVKKEEASENKDQNVEQSQAKPKLGIEKGQVAVVDVEIKNPSNKNGYHVFTAGGKSYSVIFNKSGEFKGWQFFNLNTNEVLLLGQNKEEARTNLAKLINSKAPINEGFVVNEESNSEILKKVVWTPPAQETMQEKIDRLKKAAEDQASKFISDKIDGYISTIEQPARKSNWVNNKEAIAIYINDVIAGAENSVDALFDKLKSAGVKPVGISSIIKDADNIISSISKKAKEQIQKERNKSDEVSKELAKSEAKAKIANSKSKDQVDKDLALDNKPNRVRYSIGSEQVGESVNPKEAQDYIDSLQISFSVDVIETKDGANLFKRKKAGIKINKTRKVTNDGHQWRGCTYFSNGQPNIIINVSNIRDLNQLKNVINEELAHIAYGDAKIRKTLDKIISSTKIDYESLKGVYKKREIKEESVVKRMADLVDSYTEKGMFDKLFTSVKAFIKNNLGIELSDNDLSYIAYRAIVRASKVTSTSNNETKFSYAGEKADKSQLMNDSLEAAKAMAAAGKSSEEIRALTGWFPGKYDGKMRFEIPDNKASFVKTSEYVEKATKIYGGPAFSQITFASMLDKVNSGNFLKLSDVFNHDELFAAYPEAANIPFFPISGNIVQGSHRILDGKNIITATVALDGDNISKESTSVIIHEIQHFIQNKEGFASGGSPDNLITRADIMDAEKFKDAAKGLNKYKSELDYLAKTLAEERSKKPFLGLGGPNQKTIKSIEDSIDRVQKSVNDIWDYQKKSINIDRDSTRVSLLSAINLVDAKLGTAWALTNRNEGLNMLYRLLAGEIESRDVQDRIDYTEEQRKSVAPYSSENIAKENAIIKFNNNGESSSINTNDQSSPFDSYTEAPDVFSELTDAFTTEQKDTFEKIQKMLRKKLEKKLLIDEPAAWSLLKSVKFKFLKDEDLRSYNRLLDEFVRTRSKNRDPKSDIRRSVDVVIAEASDLAKKANQGHFDWLQSKHEFLEDKDFMANYQGDIDLVMQLARDDRGTNDSNLPSSKDGESMQTWQRRTIELQELVFNNLDYMNDRRDEMFPSVNTVTDNPILAKYVNAFDSNKNDIIEANKKVFNQRMNKLMEDPTEKSYRDLRKQYFGLMDFIADGYALNIEDFVSQDTVDALNTELSDKDIIDMHKAPWRKKWLSGASSFYANTRMLGTKVAGITSKLTSRFRTGIMAAERIHDEFTKPVLKEMYENAVKENGGKDFNGQELNHAGIYSMSRAFKSTEGVTEGILNSKRSIESSIQKDLESVYSARKTAAENHLQFLNDLFAGITSETPNEEAMGILETNAERIMPKGLIGYVKGINSLFEMTKPLAKFTSEFGLGKPFEHWVNYTPTLAITKEGQPIDFDLTDMSANISSDESVNGDFNKDTNMQKSGGGSLRDRTRRLGKGMVYVFNINHLAENRMRLNLIDYLTLQQRRELNNVISGNGTVHKQFAQLLKDESGSKERVSHIQQTVRTMWSNTIQSASFISEFQAGINVFSNMWASGKLASLYQLPGQFASNLAPYFIVHSGNPKRIGYLFDAMGILLKRQMGHKLEPRLEKVVSRILSTVKGRSQEQFLDKSIALDVNGSDVWQQVKTSSFWSSIKTIDKLREKILFAQFTLSDLLTAAPMMLANMMINEETAGRATSFDGLTFNDESFIKSVDDAERFVGIGASSRRGVWTNNKNGYLVALRNMLSAFSSHRINNATNFAIEFAKVTNNNTSSDEKVQAVKYMLGIQAQSAVFSVIKWGMVGMFYNLLTNAMGDDENEDELEKNYKKLLADKNISKEQKKMIQAEVSMREKLMNEYKKAKDKNNSYEVLIVRGVQDMVANSLLIPAVTDVPVNALIHNTYDKVSAQNFNGVKEAEISRLNEILKRAKANKNISLAAATQKEISQWEAQEAVTFVYEGQSLIPFDGVYGGVLKDAAKFVDTASTSVIKGEAMSIADIFLGTGIVGLSQPDLNRIARMYSKKAEYEAEYKEKIEAIKAGKKD